MTMPADDELAAQVRPSWRIALAPSQARDRLLQWLGGPGLRHPERLLDVVREAQDLFIEADETTRETVWNITVVAIGRTGPDLGGKDADLEAKAAGLRTRLSSHRYSADQVAAGLVSLAFLRSNNRS